ncbi:hypothetical protein ABPG74_012570 [Tetrahymena malaccensis]
MIQVEEQDQNQIIQCQQHKGYTLQFLNTDLSSDNNQIAYCARCITANHLQGKDLLFFADITDLDESQVLDNWPIVEDKAVLSNLKNTLNYENDNDYIQTIEQFIDELQKKFNHQLIEMKKSILNQMSENLVTKQKLIEIYNNISQKKLLQSSIQQIQQGNKQGLQLIENIIKESYKNRNQNQQILHEEFQKLQENQQFLELKFPKLIQKQLFQNLKLIQQYFLNKNFRKDQFQKVEIQDNLQEFKDYMSQCSSVYDCDEVYFKELSFNKLSNPQFDYILKTTQFEIQKNQQISLLDEKKSTEYNYNIFQYIEKLIKDYQNITQEYGQQQQQNLDLLMLNHKYELDVTEKYKFVKSQKDNCSQSNQIIKKSKDGLTKIKQINQQLMVQFFTEKAIDPSKKYTIQFEIEPFVTEEDSYKIAIGVIQKSKCNFQWLDQDNLSNSDLFFSNHNSNKFTLCKKGLLFNNNLIRRSELMRKLEIQFCLNENYFQIADYPNYTNITQARKEEAQRYQSNQEYVFGIEHYSIKSIKILKFIEGYMIKN